MATANDLYQDALIARAFEIEQLKDATSRKVIALLNRTEADLISKLRDRLRGLGDPNAGQRFLITDRYQRLLDEIRTIREETWKEANELLKQELLALSKEEAALVLSQLPAAVGITMEVILPTAATLAAVVNSKPFRGRILRKWAQSLTESDLRSIQDAIQIGLVQGESIDDIVTRLRGTRATAFAGTFQTSRRNAQAVVRTAIIHVTNAAREAVYLENRDIILGLKWTAVLDGRTTPICMSRDGKIAPLPGNEGRLPAGTQLLVPVGARPPAHFACRSIMIAVLDGLNIVGERPFVEDTRTPNKREVNFREIARRAAGDRWKNMSRSARTAQIRNVRKQWALDRVGRVPSETTYAQFLERRSAEFQDKVLGPARGRAFRKGASLDDLVTRSGKRIPLSELRRRLPLLFETA